MLVCGSDHMTSHMLEHDVRRNEKKFLGKTEIIFIQLYVTFVDVVQKKLKKLAFFHMVKICPSNVVL